MSQENLGGIKPDDFDTPGRAPASNDAEAGELQINILPHNEPRPRAGGVPSYATGEANEPLSEGAAMAGVAENIPTSPTEKLDETGEQWQSFIERNYGSQGIPQASAVEVVSPREPEVVGDKPLISSYEAALKRHGGDAPVVTEAQGAKAEVVPTPALVATTAEAAPQPAAKTETQPQSPEEQKAVQEFVAQMEKKSEPERAEIGFRLANAGFHVERFKNGLLKNIFQKTSNEFDQGTTTSRFLGALSGVYARQQERNEKAAQSIDQLKMQGVQTGIMAKMGNYGFLAGNFAKLAGMLGPLGWAVATTMAGANLAEAGKEMRLTSEEAMEKTRISAKNLTTVEMDQAMAAYKATHPEVDFTKEEDRERAVDEFAVNKAADEAWGIYEKAMKNKEITTKLAKGNATPEMQMQAAKEVIKAEDLKKAYDENVAGTVLARLENRLDHNRGNPTAPFVSRMAEKFIGHIARGTEKRIQAIEQDSKLTPAQKQQKKELLLNRFGRGQMLKDIDRMLSQQGALDVAGARWLTGEKALKGLVYGLSAISIWKLHETLTGSAAEAGAEAATASTPDALDFGSEPPLVEAAPVVPDALDFGSEAPLAEAAPGAAAVAGAEATEWGQTETGLPALHSDIEAQAHDATWTNETDTEINKLHEEAITENLPPEGGLEEPKEAIYELPERPLAEPLIAGDPNWSEAQSPAPTPETWIKDEATGLNVHADDAATAAHDATWKESGSTGQLVTEEDLIAEQAGGDTPEALADLEHDATWVEGNTGINELRSDAEAGLVAGASIEKIPDYNVASGDNLTNIITKQIPGATETDVQNLLRKLSPDQWKELGIGSGDPHLIRPGESIQLDRIQEFVGAKNVAGLQATTAGIEVPQPELADPTAGIGDTAHTNPDLADPTADIDPVWGKDEVTDLNMTHEDIASAADTSEGAVLLNQEAIPPYEVKSGDSLYRVLDQRGSSPKSIMEVIGNTENSAEWAAYIKDKPELTELWKQIVPSGDPHLIQPGQMIDMDKLHLLMDKVAATEMLEKLKTTPEAWVQGSTGIHMSPEDLATALREQERGLLNLEPQDVAENIPPSPPPTSRFPFGADPDSVISAPYTPPADTSGLAPGQQRT